MHNAEDNTQCECCKKFVFYAVFFYLYKVCDKCAQELKNITKGRNSEDQAVLLFFIRCHAIFLKKSEKADIACFNGLDPKTLARIALLFKDMSQSAIIK